MPAIVPHGKPFIAMARFIRRESARAYRALTSGGHILALGVLALLGTARPAAAECPKIPYDEGKSIDYFFSEKTSGKAVPDGSVLPANTIITLDAYAAAYGRCEPWLMDCTSLVCHCVLPIIYERTVNHIHFEEDVATQSLNGHYIVGRYFGMDATGKTAWYHELDSRNPAQVGNAKVTNLLLYPGVYVHYVSNIINRNRSRVAVTSEA